MPFNVAGFEVEIQPEKVEALHSDGTPVTAWSCTIKSEVGLNAEVLVKDFGAAGGEVRLSNFLSTPAPVFDHLDRNGAMTCQVLPSGDWVALVRALRPGGKPHPTLNHVTLEELADLLGEDFQTWAGSFGFTVGTWAGLNPTAGRFKESVAASIPAEKAYLLVLPWTLSRPVALMKKLGYDQAIV